MNVRTFAARFDWVSFLSAVALTGIGAAALASAGEARGTAFMASRWKSMLATAAVGFVLYFAIAFSDYRRLLDRFAIPAYVLSIVSLVAVLVVGSVQFGGRRWLWFFQPSEVAKLCTLAFLAHVFGSWRAEGFRGFKAFLAACAAMGLPVVLILLEPDLGTALVLIPAAVAMLLVTGVWRKGIVALLAAAAVAASALLGAVCEAERPGVAPERREAIRRFIPLRDHQIARVKTFLFPETDALGAGYNLRQARMAIGSGGAGGKGWKRGEAVRRGLLPPMGAMTDFIFCAWAEETGFLKGSLPLLALFAALCISTARVALAAADLRGRMLATGVATLVFAHVYVNLGMSLGLVPVTGLPLPFVSLGRTFLATVLCALGLAQSVSLHREEYGE